MLSKSRIYLTGAFLMIWSSCDITFEQPQPVHSKKLNAVPPELRGTYTEAVTGDTLLVSADSYEFKIRSSDLIHKRGSLKEEDVVLKKMNGNYILNRRITGDIPESFPENLWLAYLLKYKNNSLKVYFLKTDVNFDQMADSVREIVPLKELKDGDEKGYALNPSKRQFRKLIKSGLFREYYSFKKILAQPDRLPGGN